VERDPLPVPLEEVYAAHRDPAGVRQRRHEQEHRRLAGERDIAHGEVLLEQVGSEGAVAAQHEPRPPQRRDRCFGGASHNLGRA
jgi:hypothetical protein